MKNNRIITIASVVIGMNLFITIFLLFDDKFIFKKHGLILIGLLFSIFSMVLFIIDKIRNNKIK